MKLRNKILCLVMAFLLLTPYTGMLALAAETPTSGSTNLTGGTNGSNVTVPTGPNSISISNSEEFVEFAHNCSLDSWSTGKIVTLTADIDLSGYSDTTIPIFGGTFNGSGFTVSGLEFTEEGSNQGLFRYIQKGGTVKDLTVLATVIADGTAYNIGGIAGSNAGTIQKCTFNGTVIGNTAVGGVVGTNEESGKIIEATVKGTVDGAIQVGGIAGVNYGSLTKCANLSDVGTDTQEGGSFDIGGIAGYSTGTIESCTNTGDVGALHTGYNIGGVVGRQDGLVNGAVNKGEVYGRKDVGGIVGQAEPTINVIFSDDLLEKLNTELTSLYELLDGMIDDSDDFTADIQKRLKNASNYINTASSSTNSLLTQLSGAVGSVGGGSELTSSTALIYASLGNYSAVMQDIKSAVGDLTDGVEKMIEAIRSINSVTGSGVASASEALKNANELVDVLEEMDDGVVALETEISSLRNAVLQKNEEDMEECLEKLVKNIAELGNTFVDVADLSMELLDNLEGLMSSDSKNQKKVRDSVDDFIDALDVIDTSAEDASEALDKIDAAVEPDWTELQKNLKSMAECVEDMSEAAGDAKTAFKTMEDGLEAFSPALTDLDKPVEKLASVAETGGEAFSDIETAFGKIESYLTDLANADPEAETNDTTTSTLGSAFKTQSQTLYRAIVSLSSEITGLSTDLGKGTENSIKSMEGINDQFQVVMALVVEAIEGADEDDAGTIKDISDDKVSAAKTGKLLECSNSGLVMGDIDVGGVVGAMSIENELDREDAQNDTLSAENQYEIMAIVTGCLNDGEVIGTKSAVGGIVGRMELGTVIDCENYGTVRGTGEYAGGIAGLSNASVRRSYSKSIISGDTYVGGIVGKGHRVDACYAIVVIEDSDEYVGAIAGWGDTAGELVTDNYYLDNGVAAIDGVSYHKIAEPIALASMKSKTGLPSGFATFKITCMNGDEVLETVTVEYGADLSQVVMPEVPERENLYGYWSDFTTELMLVDQTVYAEYGRWVTVISSKELDDGRAFALAEGEFTRYSELHVYESAEEAPSDNAWGVWNVSLYDVGITEESVTTIKLLNQTGEFASIWQLKDGEWVKLNTGRDGQYLVISMKGTSGTFCFRPDYLIIILIVAILVATVVGLVVVVILMIRNRKKKSGPKKPRKPKVNEQERALKDIMEEKEAKEIKKAQKAEKAQKPQKTKKAKKTKGSDLKDHNGDEQLFDFQIPDEKPAQLTSKEKRALKRREKCEKRRAKRILDSNREAE